ncbi:MAG: type IV pilus modification protein PilV [Burkholderiaceae bacterium]|nr:type IV pilus modification protein PilV [Burkholderiaceae bacterium]
MKLRTFSASFRSLPLTCVQATGQRGFSMIEVLISIVVLSFGLLGSVGLQSFALKSNREGRLQSVATTLAREYAEMMRGNKYIGVKPAAANNPYLLNDKTIKALSDLPTAWAYCLHTGCEDGGVLTAKAPNTAVQTKVAQSQVLEWMARALGDLPGAWVRVCFDEAPFDSNGLPQWDCTAPTGGATANSTIVIKMGWTQSAIDRGQTGDAALQKADTRPTLIFPVTSGNEQ